MENTPTGNSPQNLPEVRFYLASCHYPRNAGYLPGRSALVTRRGQRRTEAHAAVLALRRDFELSHAAIGNLLCLPVTAVASVLKTAGLSRSRLPWKSGPEPWILEARARRARRARQKEST